VDAAYGSLGSHAGGPVAQRNTFLIGPDGKIDKVWTTVNPATHHTDVYNELSVKPPIVNVEHAPLGARQAAPSPQEQGVKPPIIH